MQRSNVALIALLASVAPALAEDYVTERGHLICTSQESLRDAQKAISNRDKVWLDSIQQCTRSQEGLKAEILQDGTITAKVKIYDEDGRSTVYWTSRDTVKDKRR